MHPSAILLVGVGGFFGAVARYLVSTVSLQRWGTAWPVGTFLINISGCFAIGLLLALFAARGTPDGWRLLIPVGFVGAYTTFSTFAYETLQLVERGAWARAGSYVLASNLVGYGAVLLGVWLIRRLE
jgi:CrcB protein